MRCGFGPERSDIMDGRKSEMVSSSNSACLGGVLGGDDAVDTRGTSSKGLPWPANLVGRALFLELLFLNLFLILRHQPILAQVTNRVALSGRGRAQGEKKRPVRARVRQMAGNLSPRELKKIMLEDKVLTRHVRSEQRS